MKRYLFMFMAMITMSANAQDVIIMKNGDEIQALVKKVGQTEIEYKKWTNREGPSYTMDKSEIFMIKYKNGDKDVFKEEAKNKTEMQEPVSQGLAKEPQSDPVRNQGLIDSYNYNPVSYIDNDESKKAELAFCVYGVGAESVLCNEDIEISFEGGFDKNRYDSKKYFCYNMGYTIKVTNRSSQNIYINLERTFFVYPDGESLSFYDNKQVVTTESGSSGASVNLGSVTSALGIGGILGTLAGGVNVGGSNGTSTTTIKNNPQYITIPPHANVVLNKFLHLNQYLEWGWYSYVNLGLKPKRGHYASYSENNSPIKYHVTVNYSKDEYLPKFFDLSSSIYLKDVYASKRQKSRATLWGHDKDDFRNYEDVKLGGSSFIILFKDLLKKTKTLPR